MPNTHIPPYDFCQGCGVNSVCMIDCSMDNKMDAMKEVEKMLAANKHVPIDYWNQSRDYRPMFNTPMSLSDVKELRDWGVI